MEFQDKNCRYLNLYHDDFECLDIWKQVCDSLNVPYDIDKVTIFYDTTKTKINTFNDDLNKEQL
jgi:hypothetical protein